MWSLEWGIFTQGGHRPFANLYVQHASWPVNPLIKPGRVDTPLSYNLTSILATKPPIRVVCPPPVNVQACLGTPTELLYSLVGKYETWMLNYLTRTMLLDKRKKTNIILVSLLYGIQNISSLKPSEWRTRYCLLRARKGLGGSWGHKEITVQS